MEFKGAADCGEDVPVVVVEDGVDDVSPVAAVETLVDEASFVNNGVVDPDADVAGSNAVVFEGGGPDEVEFEVILSNAKADFGKFRSSFRGEKRAQLDN